MEKEAYPLVVRCGALGDTVLITPLLRALSLRYGKQCDVLGNEWVNDLFSQDPHVREVFALGSRRVPYYLSRTQQHAVQWLRARAKGPVFLLDSLPKIRRLLNRARISTAEMIVRDAQPRSVGLHVTDDLVRLAEAAPGAQHDLPAVFPRGTELFVAESDLLCCRAWLGQIGVNDSPYAVVQTGNSRTLKGKDAGEKKHWPALRWQALIDDLLRRHPGMFVLLSGAPSEAKMTGMLARECGSPRVMSVASEMSLPRLMALLKGARFCISVDTGPAHIAAAVGCPLVVLFGGTYPGRMAPRSLASPVIVVSGPPGAPEPEDAAAWVQCHSMEAISVAMVMGAFLQLEQLLN